MNCNKNLLNERIGIDRSVVYDFILKSIDTEKLTEKSKTTSGTKSFVKFVKDDKSPIELADGTKVGKLIIKDQYLGKLTVSFEKNNLKNTYYVNSTLELMVSGTNNNLQNLTTKEYQTRIIDIFDYLKEQYGVEADYSTLKVKKLELNATFFLDEEYAKYKQPILLIMRNVSPKRFGTNATNNAVKYATWHEANMELQTDKLETALVKNSSIELKIYNKKKHLQDIGELGELERDIMRVEYTIKDKRILKNAFDDDLVTSLSDEKINKLFKKYFNRDVVARYYTWAAENHKALVELTKKHQDAQQKWTGYFFRECRQYAELHGLPILFDIEDMRKVFRELEPKTGRNAGRKFRKFRDKAIYEDDLNGNTQRIKEIISKVMGM